MSFLFEKISILGLGLLGGSVAMAAKKAGIAREVVAWGRREKALANAQAQGVVDSYHLDPREAVDGADLVLLAVPVDRMESLLEELAGSLAKGVLVSDVGSVKGALSESLPKLLPAGGLVWTPNANTKFEILFPDPKLAWRLRQVGNMEWWVYGRGEYGGDSWTISTPTGVIETDYNDYRVAIGMEFDDNRRWDGYFEVGHSFEREIYRLGATRMTPNSTVFVGAGLAY